MSSKHSHRRSDWAKKPKEVPADDVGPKKAVAYLDIGEGGYLDLGSDLSDEALRKLPKGRHMLAIVGTYSVDGYVPVAAPTTQEAPQQEPVAWRHSKTLCLYETKAEVPLADGDEWAEPLYLATPQPAPVAQGDAVAALQPFAEIGAWLFARDLPDETPVVEVRGINGTGWILTRGHFKAAALAARAQAKEGGAA